MSARIVLSAACLVTGCEGIDRLAAKIPDDAPMQSRKALPVESGVQHVLAEWQRRRATTKSIFATFNYTFQDRAFKTQRKSTGSLRYRHPDAGRIDIRNWTTEIWSKSNEYWSVKVPDRRISIMEWGDPKTPSPPMLFGILQDSPYVWLTPSDQVTIRKQGKVTKMREDEHIVVLSVERVGSYRDFFSQAVVHLRKSDWLPVKLIVRENQDVEITFDFTEIIENPDLDDAQFDKPRLNEQDWKITRHRFATKPAMGPSEKASGIQPPSKSK